MRAARPTTARRRTCARSRVRARAASSSAGRAEGGDVRRELRQHLAVQRAVDQGRREQRGAVEHVARTAAATSSVSRSVATSTASQPHRTSSPSGVRPPPLPTRSSRIAASIASGDPGVPRGQPRRQSGRRARAAAGRGGRASAFAGLAARPRTLPRSIRGTRTSTNRPTGGGDRSDTGSRAQHRGSAAPRRAPAWADTPEACAGEPQRARHLGGPGSDDADAAAGHLDVQRGRRVVQHPDRVRPGRCAGARPRVAAR